MENLLCNNTLKAVGILIIISKMKLYKFKEYHTVRKVQNLFNSAT